MDERRGARENLHSCISSCNMNCHHRKLGGLDGPPPHRSLLRVHSTSQTSSHWFASRLLIGIFVPPVPDLIQYITSTNFDQLSAKKEKYSDCTIAFPTLAKLAVFRGFPAVSLHHVYKHLYHPLFRGRYLILLRCMKEFFTAYISIICAILGTLC